MIIGILLLLMVQANCAMDQHRLRQSISRPIENYQQVSVRTDRDMVHVFLRMSRERYALLQKTLEEFMTAEEYTIGVIADIVQDRPKTPGPEQSSEKSPLHYGDN